MANKNDNFHIGVLCALACVYNAGQETLAEEIVAVCGMDNLLRIATKEDDIYLPQLRETVRILRERILNDSQPQPPMVNI